MIILFLIISTERDIFLTKFDNEDICMLKRIWRLRELLYTYTYGVHSVT